MLIIMTAMNEHMPGDTCRNLSVNNLIVRQSAVLPRGITSKLLLLIKIRAPSGHCDHRNHVNDVILFFFFHALDNLQFEGVIKQSVLSSSLATCHTYPMIC